MNKKEYKEGVKQLQLMRADFTARLIVLPNVDIHRREQIIDLDKKLKEYECNKFGRWFSPKGNYGGKLFQ